MVKRKVGERAEILFDSIDLEVLKKFNSFNNAVKVLELADSLKINHNSLKPHIDKLMTLGLINTNKNKEGISGASLYFKQDTNPKIILEYLEKANSYLKNKPKSETSIDLRKKEDKANHSK